MGRAALVISETKLAECVKQLESEKTFATLGDLCQAVADSEWGKSIRNVKHQIRGISAPKVYQTIRDYNIICATKPGKRGRASGTSVDKSSRAEKLAEKKVMPGFAIALKSEVDQPGIPDKYKALAEKALSGSFKAAIQLHCAQCTGYTDAYKACDGALGGVPCGLYPANLLMFPNRRKMVEGDDGFFGTERDKDK